MEVTEDTTVGVQIEEEMSVIRAMQIVTKLWVSVRKSDRDRDGCRVSLTCFSWKEYDSCGKKQEPSVQVSISTPHCTPAYRSCENDWRRIMATALKLLLKKLILIPPQMLL